MPNIKPTGPSREDKRWRRLHCDNDKAKELCERCKREIEEQLGSLAASEPHEAHKWERVRAALRRSDFARLFFEGDQDIEQDGIALPLVDSSGFFARPKRTDAAERFLYLPTPGAVEYRRGEDGKLLKGREGELVKSRASDNIWPDSKDTLNVVSREEFFRKPAAAAAVVKRPAVAMAKKPAAAKVEGKKVDVIQVPGLIGAERLCKRCNSEPATVKVGRTKQAEWGANCWREKMKAGAAKKRVNAERNKREKPGPITKIEPAAAAAQVREKPPLVKYTVYPQDSKSIERQTKGAESKPAPAGAFPSGGAEADGKPYRPCVCGASAPPEGPAEQKLALAQNQVAVRLTEAMRTLLQRKVEGGFYGFSIEEAAERLLAQVLEGVL